MKLDAYVDGSYNSENHTYGGGIVILMKESGKVLEHKVSGNDSNYARMRNVAGELSAALSAIEIAKAVKCEELTIYYDYEGIEKWTLNPGEPGYWRSKNQLTQSYSKIVRFAKQSMKINFVWVKGHSGNKYNEMADKLAKAACKVVKPTGKEQLVNE